MSLKAVTQETLRIIESGRYQTPSGSTIDISRELAAAVRGTVVYRPGDYDLSSAPGRPRIEVTDETTQIAARRLMQQEGISELVLLNFASARNPGGGFLGGARAQEEDLCRCSALYACLADQHAYYDANRRQSSMLYTDHIIHSPRVPFFRDRASELLEAPFFPSVITAPAPNAGEHLRRAPEDHRTIAETLARRAGMVLSVARRHAHRTLLLGAWGCGAFRNEPRPVAEAFAHWIGEMGAAFDRVVFAIPSGNANFEVFRECLGGD